MAGKRRHKWGHTRHDDRGTWLGAACMICGMRSEANLDAMKVQYLWPDGTKAGALGGHVPPCPGRPEEKP